MITDFHTHIYPDKIAGKAAQATAAFYQIPVTGDGTVDGLLESGRRGGIGRFLVFSAAQTPAQVESINTYISATCAQHPQLVGFGTLHPGMADPAAEIERMISLGLKGVKLHCDMQHFNMDDAAIMDIYELLEGRLPVMQHCGDYRYPNTHPARLARVLDTFPKLTVIAAHFGGWSLFDIAYDYLKDRRCYLDVSSSIPFLGLRRAKELIRMYGAERLLFGSDYPMWDPARELARLNELGLTDEEVELITAKNAQRILGE